jgi:hypothetical protein
MMGLLFDLLLQLRNQSVAETTFGKMSGLIGSFMTYPKKDESRGMWALQIPFVLFIKDIF